jgi:hypothetical protein
MNLVFVLPAVSRRRQKTLADIPTDENGNSEPHLCFIKNSDGEVMVRKVIAGYVAKTNGTKQPLPLEDYIICDMQGSAEYHDDQVEIPENLADAEVGAVWECQTSEKNPDAFIAISRGKTCSATIFYRDGSSGLRDPYTCNPTRYLGKLEVTT